MVLDVLERCHIQLPVLGTLWLVSNSIAANQVKETSLLSLTVESPIIFHSLLWKIPELWNTSRSVLDPRPVSRDWARFASILSAVFESIWNHPPSPPSPSTPTPDHL